VYKKLQSDRAAKRQKRLFSWFFAICGVKVFKTATCGTVCISFENKKPYKRIMAKSQENFAAERGTIKKWNMLWKA
jgi:hypothetical protein